MKLKFNVSGMTCTACSARVEKVTAAIDGVLKCEVNLLTGAMVVDADRIEVAEAVSNAVRAAGYEAVQAGHGQRQIRSHALQPPQGL